MDRPDTAGGSALGGDALIHRRPSSAVRRRALPALSTALPDFRQRCPQHEPMRDRHCSAAVRPEGRPTRPVRSTVPVTGRRLGRSRAIGSLVLWWISTIRCGSSWPGDLRGVLACVARGQRPFHGRNMPLTCGNVQARPGKGYGRSALSKRLSPIQACLRRTASPASPPTPFDRALSGLLNDRSCSPSKHYLAARARWPEIRADEGSYGAMFWLMWKRLSGSYFRLT